MTVSIPVRVGDLDILLLHVLLLLQPFFAQFVSFLALGLFALSVGKEVGVDRGVLTELGAFRRSICV
jgi:hypothetical protein